jgi:hypothetical protein
VPRLGLALKILINVGDVYQPSPNLVSYYLAQNQGFAATTNLVLYLAAFAKKNPTHPAALGLLANDAFMLALNRLGHKDRQLLLAEYGEPPANHEPHSRPDWLPDSHAAPLNFLTALETLRRTTSQSKP